jgi:hypothetical protein
MLMFFTFLSHFFSDQTKSSEENWDNRKTDKRQTTDR